MSVVTQPPEQRWRCPINIERTESNFNPGSCALRLGSHEETEIQLSFKPCLQGVANLILSREAPRAVVRKPDFTRTDEVACVTVLRGRGQPGLGEVVKDDGKGSRYQKDRQEKGR